MESFHTASPNRISSLSSANFGAKSPSAVRPAVWVIIRCAITFEFAIIVIAVVSITASLFITDLL